MPFNVCIYSGNIFKVKWDVTRMQMIYRNNFFDFHWMIKQFFFFYGIFIFFSNKHPFPTIIKTEFVLLITQFFLYENTFWCTKTYLYCTKINKIHSTLIFFPLKLDLYLFCSSVSPFLYYLFDTHLRMQWMGKWWKEF